MSIDPATCKPDQAYVVTLRSGATSIAMRLVGLNRRTPWAIPNGGNFVWLGDDEVAVLHRLVPEPEEKVLDVPTPPWDTLREAARIMHPPKVAPGLWTTTERYLRLEADRLEAEHRTAQEKAEQDAAREALIEKAAKALAFAGERNDLGVSSDVLWSNHLTPSTRERYLAQARALADAGFPAEPGEAS
ncbi:hypothetical protein [Gordonia malaquae]|uniref:hypothetical protein n=1 Tax=Gordonia malaquae TaxID=410332 RepID=UPI0030FEB2FA